MISMAMLHDAQRVLKPVINRTPVIPYQSHFKHDSTPSATDLCPIIIHAGSLD